MVTGEVILNNGHLEGMEDERDTGTTTTSRQPHGNNLANVNGGSLLRAMTVAPEDHDLSLEYVKDDNVIMSIETMAGNVAGSSDDEDVESESEEASVESGQLYTSEEGEYLKSIENRLHGDDTIKQESDNDSDARDSLLGIDSDSRSTSPDSLFENQDDKSSSRESCRHDRNTFSEAGTTASDGEPAVSAIIHQFGPRIGPQVLDVIQRRHAMSDAHVETAWRLPDTGVVFPTVKSNLALIQPRRIPSLPRDTSDSIWGQPRRPRRRSKPANLPASRRPRDVSEASAESEDPLQQEFHDDEEVYDAFGDHSVDLEDGICTFCGKRWAEKQSVLVHWDDLIRNAAEDGIHDMAYIRDHRCRARRRVRYPNLTIVDFRQIVKLHEVDKMDWPQLQEQGNFGGRPVTSLHAFYYHYRATAKTDEELAAEGREWTEKEDTRLRRLCEDPSMTFRKLKRLLKTRTQSEIGNRLASVWMQEYAERDTHLADLGSNGENMFVAFESNISVDHSPSNASDVSSVASRRDESVVSVDSLLGVDEDSLIEVKVEISDDDLFNGRDPNGFIL